eukprot:TRINITY_DN8696_c1_g1_i1.p1 TRINITY_DN8696_c1_g1~~TRINITY_DN8696_c1_g1_i1.p1  ORF type:complete len:173 (-),score=22.54 TRINITY_DN8696_c1_g1_i1:96-614(-)
MSASNMSTVAQPVTQPSAPAEPSTGFNIPKPTPGTIFRCEETLIASVTLACCGEHRCFTRRSRAARVTFSCDSENCGWKVCAAESDFWTITKFSSKHAESCTPTGKAPHGAAQTLAFLGAARMKDVGDRKYTNQHLIADAKASGWTVTAPTATRALQEARKLLYSLIHWGFW